MVKKMLMRKRERLNNMIEIASQKGHIAELVLLNGILFKLSMIDEQIKCLRQWAKLKPNDRKANYYLAKALSKSGSGTPKEIAEYFRSAYVGGNRNIKFLFDYVSHCARNRLYEHVDIFSEGINDFLAYGEEEHELKKRLEAILKGYRLNRDRDKLSSETSELISHIEATKGLSSEDELYYIDMFEASNPKKALEQCEKHLIIITPSRPKSILLRIAYIASRLPDMVDKAKQYFEELYDLYIKDRVNEDDFQITLRYLEFAIEKNIYKKDRYYSLYYHCKKMKKSNLDLYALFAEYLSRSQDIKDLLHCKKVVDEGLAVATSIDRLYVTPAKKLRSIKEQITFQIQDKGCPP